MSNRNGKEVLHEELEKMKNNKGYKAHLSPKGITIDFLREDIEKNLPNLAKELNDPDGMQVSLNEYNNTLIETQDIDREENINHENSINLSSDEMKANIVKNVKSKYNIDSELYYPKTQDFLRRCSTIEEAKEILDHQVKMKEISIKEKEELLRICEEKGLEYFGPKKEPGYYERKYKRN